MLCKDKRKNYMLVRKMQKKLHFGIFLFISREKCIHILQFPIFSSSF